MKIFSTTLCVHMAKFSLCSGSEPHGDKQTPKKKGTAAPPISSRFCYDIGKWDKQTYYSDIFVLYFTHTTHSLCNINLNIFCLTEVEQLTK